MREADLQSDIRLALGMECDLTLWRNSVGVAETDKRTMRYGLCKGSSDLIGILAPSGRLVALEIKTPIGRVSPEQQLFLNLIRRRGGFAAVVRSVAEARAALDRARAGANE